MSFQNPPDAVVLRDIQVLRDGMTLFHPLSAILCPGQIIWLLGRNGSGKTSLLQFLGGAPVVARGQILLNGETIDPKRPEWLRHLARLGHRLGLQPELTVAENAAFLGGTAGRMETALDDLGLHKLRDVPVEYLSQGQKQILAWGVWVLSRPARLWLLDEAFVHLDAEAGSVLAKVCTAHTARGGMIVYTAHQPVTGLPPTAQWRLEAA